MADAEADLRLKKALELIEEAKARLLVEFDPSCPIEHRMDHYSSALWRLLDATGLMSPLCFSDAFGLGHPTGRGFLLVQGEAWAKNLHPGEL